MNSLFGFINNLGEEYTIFLVIDIIYPEIEQKITNRENEVSFREFGFVNTMMRVFFPLFHLSKALSIFTNVFFLLILGLDTYVKPFQAC